MKQQEITLVSLNQKIDDLANSLIELAEVVNESFSKLHIYLDNRFERLEKRVTIIEDTMSTKTQVEVLTDILRTNGVISRFEARRISKAQPAD